MVFLRLWNVMHMAVNMHIIDLELNFRLKDRTIHLQSSLTYPDYSLIRTPVWEPFMIIYIESVSLIRIFTYTDGRFGNGGVRIRLHCNLRGYGFFRSKNILLRFAAQRNCFGKLVHIIIIEIQERKLSFGI